MLHPPLVAKVNENYLIFLKMKKVITIYLLLSI